MKYLFVYILRALTSASRPGLVGGWCVALCLLAASMGFAGEMVGSGSLRPTSAQTPPPGANSSAPLIELDGSISLSPDGSELQYRWRQVSGPQVELSDPASAKPRFRTNIPGIYEFELVVSANGMDSEPHLVRLEIERENLPPVAKLAGEVLGQVGKPLEIDGSGSTDPEGEKLTYQWRLLTPGLEIPAEALTSPVLSFEPNVDGVFEVELTVSDGDKTSAPVRCLVRVKPKPRPPVAQARIITVSIPSDVQPADGLAAMAAPKVETVSAPPPAIQPAPSAAPEMPAVAEAVEVAEAPMPSPAAHAVAGLVDDAWVPTKSMEITAPAPIVAAPAPAFPAPVPILTAAPEIAAAPPLPPPPPPQAAPVMMPHIVPDQQEQPIALAPVAELSPVSDLVAMPTPELNYLTSSSPAPMAAPVTVPIPVPVPIMETSSPLVSDVLSSMTRPTTMPGVGSPSMAPISSMPSLSTDPAYSALSMSATPPVARINAPASAEAGKMIMLDARDSYSPSGSRLEYSWRQKSGPPVSDVEVVFDGAAERFMPTIPGEYEFELMVADRGVVSEPVSHRVQVLREPDPPVAVVVAPTHALPGSLVKMDATQSYDALGGQLTYRWRQTGGPAVRDYIIDERWGNSAPAFRPEEPGLYSFSLSVFNGKTASKQVDIDIEVTEAVRRPPGLSIGGADRAKVGERLVFNAVATDATGWNLTYSWRQVEGPAQALSPSGGIRAMVLPPVAGRYVFALSAKDDTGREVATAERVLEVGGGKATAGSAPYVTPPTPVNRSSEAGPRRVPELTPLPNTQAATPKTFPQPQMRGASGSRSAQVLQKQPSSR